MSDLSYKIPTAKQVRPKKKSVNTFDYQYYSNCKKNRSSRDYSKKWYLIAKSKIGKYVHKKKTQVIYPVDRDLEKELDAKDAEEKSIEDYLV